MIDWNRALFRADIAANAHLKGMYDTAIHFYCDAIRDLLGDEKDADLRLKTAPLIFALAFNMNECVEKNTIP